MKCVNKFVAETKSSNFCCIFPVCDREVFTQDFSEENYLLMFLKAITSTYFLKTLLGTLEISRMKNFATIVNA